MKKLVSLIWGVFAACTVATAQGGSWSVSGSVTDQTGNVLPGVAVQEKGTTHGVATDRDGAFTLSCAPNATLIFSYLGFTSQEVRVNGRSLLQVQMKEDSHVIDEVMVVAYGTAKKVVSPDLPPWSDPTRSKTCLPPALKTRSTARSPDCNSPLHRDKPVARPASASAGSGR
ncbi:MAG: carboxypeptidase-like regulatory domain-containing protein [Bacteroides sp.]|nr:carboxypeptidase-like regulatory domain-containing protein [Bacteroides sp.]